MKTSTLFSCTLVCFWCVCFYASATRTALLAHCHDSTARERLRIGRCFVRAYPDYLDSASADTLYWRNGLRMPMGALQSSHALSSLSSIALEDALNHASLADHCVQLYPYGAYVHLSDSSTFSVVAPDSVAGCSALLGGIPPRHYNPGRFRYEPFFKAMYGSTEEEVRKHLVPVVWMPRVFARYGQTPDTLFVTTVNNVHKRFQALSDELELLSPQYYPYLAKPAGTFAWRTIAGTERLSTHSFGMTLDLNLQYTDYWFWNRHKTATFIPYRNRIPAAIVHVFEKHGFIWGGRWYHYDTMHFEYRPELLLCSGCQILSPKSPKTPSKQSSLHDN